jgi:uncharacterized protein YoxC
MNKTNIILSIAVVVLFLMCISNKNKLNKIIETDKPNIEQLQKKLLIKTQELSKLKSENHDLLNVVKKQQQAFKESGNRQYKQN